MAKIDNLKDFAFNKDKYTIICTEFQYGQIIETKEQNEVRNECERLKRIFGNEKIKDKDIYIRIEVVNNCTGEIREYWNNHENKIQF